MNQRADLELALEHATDERAERRAANRILRWVEKEATIGDLKEAQAAATTDFLKKHAGAELWWRGQAKEPEALLQVIRESRDKLQIAKAIERMGELQYRPALPDIIKFLDDPELRDNAAMALREMPTQEALGPLMRSIRNHPDLGCECQLYAMELIDCSEAVELLVDEFISAPDNMVVRTDVFACFDNGVQCISQGERQNCIEKIRRAVRATEDKRFRRALRQLLVTVLQLEEK